MKKLLLVLLVITATAYASISQVYKDTNVTTIPNIQLKKAIILIEYGKVCKEELGFINEKVSLLSTRISEKDSIIALFKHKDTLYRRLFEGYDSTIVNYKKIVSNNEESFAMQTKRLRRQKVAKWATLIAGFFAGYFIATK